MRYDFFAMQFISTEAANNNSAAKKNLLKKST